MTGNLPISLLRSFATLVDLRSYTATATALGITQPAVSIQMRRLRDIVGYDILDKSVPGVALTARGHRLAESTRALLKLHDEMIAASHASPPTTTQRAGAVMGSQV